MTRNEIILRDVSHRPLKIVKNAHNMEIYSPSLEENKKLNLKHSLVKPCFFNYTNKVIIFCDVIFSPSNGRSAYSVAIYFDTSLVFRMLQKDVDAFLPRK